MESASMQAHRLSRVSEVFATLPDRYLGCADDMDATYQVRLGDVGRIWEIHAGKDRCVVRTSPTRKPDVVIGTDSVTWLALREGRLSGLDAFSQRRLYARGDLDLAVGFEGLFRLPDDRPPLLRMHDVRISGARISTMTTGKGTEHAILIHGLGGSKSSFFETAAALAPDYRVHAIDLPGFGSSSKPLRAPYDAEYFARTVLRFMDALAIDRAHLIGNSMGGRVSIEVALTAAARVRALGLLAPAMAFKRGRQWAPLVRLMRPELAAIPHAIGDEQVRRRFWSMFARPDRLDPAAAELACDQFCRNYRSHAARVAFYASARNIYLDAPEGRNGFWTRLSRLEPPAIFIWGTHDRLVPAKFSPHVSKALPGARQVVLEECGHVPQVELPERTNALLRGFFADVGSGAARRPPRIARIA